MTTMTIRDIADAAGLKAETVRRMHADANRARKDGAEDERTMPKPLGKRADFSLEWDRDEVMAWMKVRQQPMRKGAVPKGVLREAIMELKRGRTNAALRVLEGAL